MSELFGFLVVDKPARTSSRHVVNVVQRLVRPAKAGHAGTLDPLATGVLVVCVGPATRLVSTVQEGTKRYQATFRFGITSETDDLESEPADVPGTPTLTREAIAAVLPEFIGEIEQVPPAHSAVHVKGRRAYQLARRGNAVRLTSRRVSVDRFEIVSFDESAQTLICDIECGGGTYIRSLGRDLAARLGTGCVMTSLRRSAVGPFPLTSAIPLDGLDRDTLTAMLQPAAMAFEDSPGRIALADHEWEEIRHGRGFRPAELASLASHSRLPLLHKGRLSAVGRYDEASGQVRPVMVFL